MSPVGLVLRIAFVVFTVEGLIMLALQAVAPAVGLADFHSHWRVAEIDAIVLPSGSAATHAGMLVGLRNLNSAIKVIGICARRARDPQHERVLNQARAASELAGCPGVVSEDDIVVMDDYLGPGYGQPTPEMKEAIALAAREEGLLLDPVYTGKSMAGLIGLARAGAFDGDQTVLYLHTGGTPALFGYSSGIGDL